MEGGGRAVIQKKFKKINLKEIIGAFTKVNEKANFRSVLYLGPGTSLWGFYS